MIQFTTSTTDILLVYDSTQPTTTTPIEFDGVIVECINKNTGMGKYEYLWNYTKFPCALSWMRKTFIFSNREERERCSKLFEAKGYTVFNVNMLGNGFSI